MTNPTHPHPTPTRPCEYCGGPAQHVSTGYDADMLYMATYWCENCKEHLYYVLPEPTQPEADELRATYRELLHTVSNADEAAVFLDAVLRLGRMGYTLNSDETDWQPPTLTEPER